MDHSALFDTSVALPAGLDIPAIRRAINHIELKTADLIDLYYEQANVFSALVGIFGTRALDSFSAYEKHRHSQTAQQRFPDLHRRGARTPLQPKDCLESKASKRPWAVQSHHDHAGWYIVWRRLVGPTESIEPGRPVVLWRVDVAVLDKTDWKYEGRSAGSTGGGRTHTFGVRRPAERLKGTAVFSRADIAIRRGKPVPKNGD